MKSNGKLIEQLVTIIENTLQGNERVKVSHNVSLKDKLGNDRQIDILIEYHENERFTFRSIIECKEKSRDGVEVNQMLAFAGTYKYLSNIVHKAIFVSTSGFQKSAIKIAEEEGILLYTLSDLAEEEIKSWNSPKIQNVEQKHRILDWRLLLREKDMILLNDVDWHVTPFEELRKKDGSNIMISDLINKIAPLRAKKLHNHLLNALANGCDINIDKEQYINISLFPLEEGIYLQKEEKEVPIGYIELRFLFWTEVHEAEQCTYKLYRDSSGKAVADVAFAKVDFSEKGVYLSVVGDQLEGKKEYYLIDGENDATRLEFEKEAFIPEKNQLVLIAKNPYPIEKENL